MCKTEISACRLARICRNILILFSAEHQATPYVRRDLQDGLAGQFLEQLVGPSAFADAQATARRVKRGCVLGSKCN